MSPIHEIPSQIVVEPDMERIDSATVEGFSAELEEGLRRVLEKYPHPEFVVDLGGVDYVSSSGMRALMAIRKQAVMNNRVRSGVTLRLSGNRKVERGLKMAGIRQLFNFEEPENSRG